MKGFALKLIRFYQFHQDIPLLTIDFRFIDGFDGNETLSIAFKINGLQLHTKICLYGTKSKTPYALSNLHCSKHFPKEKIVFISEELENKLLELSNYDKNYVKNSCELYNGLFDNMLDKIETILRENTDFEKIDYYYSSLC